MIATSKFEPTFARESFPCFDEPSMKAKYKISLVSPDGDGYRALSNMDETAREPYGDGLVKYIFNESVPMSTYLTVFIISDFSDRSGMVNLESGIGDPFKLSIYATPGQYDKTEYAYTISKDIIEFYINYFNIPYPLPQLGAAAIPDFVRYKLSSENFVRF